MKRLLGILAAGSSLLVLLTVTAGAQSLGDAAREARKEKKPATKVRYFDNDNLPTSAPISVMGVSAAPPSAEKTAAKKDEKGEEKEADTPEARKQLQEKYTADIQEQLKKIADIEHELDLLNREFRLRATMYYSDAGWQLRNPQLWAEQEQKMRAETARKQQELTAAKSKLDQMREAARKAGVNTTSLELNTATVP